MTHLPVQQKLQTLLRGGRMTKIGRTVASYAPCVGVAVVVLGALGQPAAAQDVRNWFGADNDVWNNSGNWNPQDVPDTIDEDAVSDGTNGTIIDVDGTFTVNRVLLNSGGAHTLNNGTLLFNNFTDVQGSTVNTNLATAGSFATVQIEGSATTTLTGDLFTDNAGGGTFRLAPISAGDALEVNGVLRDGTTTLSVLTEGDGTVNLNGVNTYTGTTTIAMGATGITNLTGSLTQTSGVTVTSGRLNTGGGIHDAAGLAVNGGTLGLTGDETIGALSGAGSIDLGASTLTFGDATDAEFSGVASGAGGLTKAGTGTQTLSGVNTFTGALNVDGGTLAISGTGSVLDVSSVALAAGTTLEVDGAGGNALADDAVVDLGSNATLRLVNSGEKIFRTSGASNATVDLNGQTLTLGGATGGGIVANISGAGTLRKEGAGEIQLQATNAMTGSVVVAEGTLTVRGTLNNASGFTTDSGAILRLSSASGSKIGDAADIANSGSVVLFEVDETVGTVSGGGDVILTDGTLTLSGDGDTATIGGTISGTGALAKTGDDTLTLSGANTFTGGITLNDGTLLLASDTAAGTGTVTLQRATLGFGDGVTVGNTIAVEGAGGAASLDVAAGSAEHSGVISGSGTRFVGKTGAGTLTLSGASTYTGLFNVVEGTLDVTGSLANENIGFEGPSAILILNGNSLSSDTVTVGFDQGSLIVRGNEQIGALTSGANGSVTLESGVTLTTGLDGGDDTFGGTITGDGALTKQGDGIFTLSGANTFAGGITLAEGTLRLASDTAAGTGAITTTGSVIDYADGVSIANPINLNSNSTQLQVSGTDSATQSGIISETGGTRPLEKIGTGTLTLSGANTYTGVTTVSAGTLVAANTSALGTDAGGTVVADGAALQLDAGFGTFGWQEALTLSGTGTAGDGALVAASGSNIVNGAITLTGDTRISNATALQMELNGGVTGADTSLTLNGTIVVGPLSNINLGAGSLIKDGTGAVTIRSSGNSFTGGTVVNEGSLQLVLGDALPDAGALTINAPGLVQVFDGETVGALSGDGTLALQTADAFVAGDGSDTTFSGVILESGAAGAFTKAGSGTLTLSGANTYTGVTTVSAGALNVTGSIASDTVTVENGASLSVDGAALLDTAAVTLNGTGDLTLTGSETIGSLASASGTSTVTLGANTLTMSAASTTFAGGFAGTGDVIKQGNGTFTLSGTSITGGTLFNQAGTTNVSGTWNSDIQNTATLDVTGTVDGNVTNGAGVVTVADGTVTGNVTGAGAGTVLLTGTGAVNGAVSNSATVTLSDTSNAGGVSNSTAVTLSDASSAGSVSASTTVNLADTSSVGTDVVGFTTLNLDSSNAAGVGRNVTGTTLNVATQDNAATAAVGGDVSVTTLNFGGGATGFLDTTGSLTVAGAATAQSAVLGFDIGAVGGQVQTSGLTVASFTAPTNPTTLKFEVNDALTGRGIDVSGEYVVINITDPANALDPANFVLDAANIAKSGEDSLGGALLVASLTNGSGALGTLGGTEDLVLRFQIDPAITAIGGQIATVQNLLGGVINRPSSPLIAALAFDAEDNESNGLWFRAQGGSAEVTSSTTNGTSNLPSTVDATYGGFQFGFDSGRFNALDGGEDLVAGGFAGALQGSTEAQNFNIDPNNPQQLGSLRGDVTTSDFEQIFVGGYLAYASGLFSGDVQLRFEHTDFTFDNPVIDLRDAETSAQSVTLSASGNYVYQVNDNVFIVPTGGVAITQSETRDLTFTDGSAQTTGTLSFEDHLSTIAFLGATAGYQSISAGGDAATTSFVTATVYNDFSDPRESLFSIAGSGLAPSLLSTENLGTFGEVSVGVNHVRILSDGGAGAPRQLNAGVRLDARFSDRIDAYNVTAQARLQF